MDLGGPLVDQLALGVETMVGVEDSRKVALYGGEEPRGVVLPDWDVPPLLPLN